MTPSLEELKNSSPYRRSSRRGAELLVILLLSLSCLLPAACGKKGDPVCPAGKRPAVVTDLTAEHDTKGITLRWSAPPGASGRETYRVYRSVLFRQAACPGCPRNFVPLRAAERRDSAVFQEDGRPVFLEYGGIPEDRTAVLLDGDVTEIGRAHV